MVNARPSVKKMVKDKNRADAIAEEIKNTRPSTLKEMKKYEDDTYKGLPQIVYGNYAKKSIC